MSWLSTNISKRLENPSIDFEVIIKNSNFKELSFETAADNVAKSLLGNKIFVGFSGGYDSEFIVRKLHSLKINFTPVLIEHEGLEYERIFAYETLSELGIDPKIIKISMLDFLDIYKCKIYEPLNGTSWPVAQYLACEYAFEQGGIYVDGGHLLGDGIDLVSEQNFYLPEWDFYCHALFPSEFKICNFFIHSPEIAYATLSEITDKDMTWSDYKKRVFNLKYRLKVKHINSFNPEMKKILLDMDKLKKYKPKTKVFFGSKNNLMTLIKGINYND